MGFIQNLEVFNKNIALEDKQGLTLSYQELANKADLLATKIGTEKQLLFIKCKRNIDTIIGYVAALRGGHAALLLDHNLDNNLFQQLVTYYQPNGIWEGNNSNGYTYNRLNKTNINLHPDLALLLSTSGSTGSPKLVKLSQKNIQSNAQSIATYLELDASEAPITTLPLHYSYGLSVINSHLQVGAKIILNQEAITSKAFWQHFNSAKATSFTGVPYTYEMLCLAQIEKKDLPSLRYFTQAGGRLSIELTKHFAIIAQNKSINFYPMYGQTEATARISWMPSDQVTLRPDSIGITIPGGKLSLETTTGKIINKHNQEGELIYRGDNVMMGYANSVTDLAQGDELKGVLKTGDLAKRDADGYYYITGRLKRFIKILGNRINLEDIESTLNAKGFKCKCTGKDNLLVIASLNSDTQQIKQYIIDKYKLHHSSIKVIHIDAFPLNSSGKVQYATLLSMYK